MKKSSNRIVRTLFILFLLVSFAVGAYVYTRINVPEMIQYIQTTKKNHSCMEGLLGCPANVEGMETEANAETPEIPKSDPKCPNLLVKKGNSLYLHNKAMPLEDGVNPKVFANLDEYIKYLDTQRKKGQMCPILYLQQESDTQGNDVYRVRPNPFDPAGGLPLTSAIMKQADQRPVKALDANRSNPPYNKDQYAGFDPHGLYIGRVTDIDQIHESTEQPSISDNPMDSNWGGVLHTQKQVDAGKYEGNIVTRVSYP